MLESSNALFGRTKILLEVPTRATRGNDDDGKARQSHPFRVGTEVRLSPRKASSSSEGGGPSPEATGVVSRVLRDTIEIVTGDDDEVLY